MKERQGLIGIFLKRLLFFSLPMLILIYILYEVIFEVSDNFPWRSIFIYTFVISVVSVANYRRKTAETPLEDGVDLESRLQAGNWKILEKEKDIMVLRPGFDFPYNRLSGDRVHLKREDGVVRLEGPRDYVDNLVTVIQGKKVFWMKREVRVVSYVLALVLLAYPVLAEAGVITRLRVDYHNYRARGVARIEIQDGDAMGNTVNNINNYGFGAVYGDHIFYVEDNMNLVRNNWDFEDKTYLVEKSSGWGISRLNIVEDWIFYHSGRTISRMRTDGTRHEVLYGMGYVNDIHVVGNWVYFVSHLDHLSVFRMDVNGQDLERIVDREVSDLAVYDNRLFYSYGTEEGGYLESSNLEGQDRRTEMAHQVTDLVRWGGYDYFIGPEDYRLYRVETGGMGTLQVLEDERVSTYFVTASGLYYTLHSPETGYPGEGLYHMAPDGTGKRQLEEARNVRSLSQVRDWILFESWEDDSSPVLKRLDIRTEEITDLE